MPKYTKSRLFEILLADAVASTYRVPGLNPRKAPTLAGLRALMDKAGLLAEPKKGA